MFRTLASFVIGLGIVAATLVATVTPAQARACYGIAPCVPVGVNRPSEPSDPPPAPKVPKPPDLKASEFMRRICIGPSVTVCGPKSRLVFTGPSFVF